MKKNFTIKINSLKDTKKLAKICVENLKTPVIICLYGEIGIGKTQFVKFLAKFWQVPDIVNSPTFTKMQIYQTKKKDIFVHLDGYHLTQKSDLGFFKEYLNEEYVVIEWPEPFVKFLNFENVINLFWKYNIQKERIVKIESYYKILEKIKKFY